MQQCGKCTLCCKLLEIKETKSPVKQWCKYCDPVKGCTIYDVRPEECRTFFCTWVQMERVHPDLRPDRCHVVFEKISNTEILGNIDPDYRMQKIVRRQVQSFKKEGFKVVMK